MLIVHFYSIFGCSNQDLGALNVFKQIAEQPNGFVNSYLPSIVHDDEFELFKNFNTLMAEGKKKESAAKFFQCPNGHLYSIGDCTKPAITLVRPDHYFYLK